jgi:GR25 family glycosyltransferase involved in LPS biosynthesis
MKEEKLQPLAFVINLPQRIDRKESSSKRLIEIGLNPEIFVATDGSKFKDSKEIHYAQDNVVALWDSHRRIWNKLLSTDHDMCFVFEDDVQFNNQSATTIKTILNINSDSFDVIQLGFLPLSSRWNNRITEIAIVVVNRMKLFSWYVSGLVFKKIISTGKIAENRLAKKIQNRIRTNSMKPIFAREGSRELKFARDFRSGTHAYLVSKSGAEKLLAYNQPVLLGADLAFQMLAISGSLKIFRLEFSIAGQDESQPSIGEHYRVPGDIGTDLMMGFKG